MLCRCFRYGPVCELAHTLAGALRPPQQGQQSAGPPIGGQARAML